MNKNILNIFVYIIFLFFFILGIFIYDDYGFSWDEYIDRTNGFVSLNFIRELLSLEIYPNFPKLETYRDANYGVIFNLPMAFVEKIFFIEDTKQIFLIRHLTNFIIFFISSIFFYLLLNKRFSKLLSIIGLVFFYLSPRIFADSFYNNKDIIFFSFFTISLYFLITFLNKITYKNAIFLSVVCALAIADRVIGIIIPFIVFIFYILESLENKSYFKKNIFKIIFFFITLILFTLIFWPYLWTNPVTNFLNTIQDMSSYEWRGGILYFGEYISGLNLPWHYTIVWILISTPILYLFLFIIGTFLILIRLTKRYLNLSKEKIFNDIYRGKKERADLITFCILFFTIFLIIELNSTLYNGWRQLYFIYPCLLFISIRGLEFFVRKFSIIKVVIFIIPFLMFTSTWMIKNHPFQFGYFNNLAGNNIRDNFEIDYYGTSNRSALEYIVKNDKRTKLNVYVVSESPYYWSLLMLDKKYRKKLNFVNDINDANFIVTNHFYQIGYPSEIERDLKRKFKLYKEFKVNEIPINSIYINK